MKIGNVIYEGELVNHTKVDYINYINEPTSYDDLDKSLPTLYVGWVFMKNCNLNNEIIQNADILEKRIISNKLYYEFSFSENKASHVKGVDNFTSLVPRRYFKPNYHYVNLDPVFFQIKDVEGIIKLLPENIDRVYNYKNEMVYILNENKIYGINLKMFDFFLINTSDLLIKIGSRIKSTISDIDGSYYQSYYKIFPNFELLRRYIVTI